LSRTAQGIAKRIAIRVGKNAPRKYSDGMKTTTISDELEPDLAASGSPEPEGPFGVGPWLALAGGGVMFEPIWPLDTIVVVIEPLGKVVGT
jgi:hypothetical protein